VSAYPIRCTDPHHPQNSAEPGWNDGVLGTVALPDGTPPAQVDAALADHICPGCAFANAAAGAAAEAARSARAIVELGFDDRGQLSPQLYAGVASFYAQIQAASTR
jgi:hypothetical protein